MWLLGRTDLQGNFAIQTRFLLLVGLLFVGVVLGEQTEFEVGPRWAPPPRGLRQSG